MHTTFLLCLLTISSAATFAQGPAADTTAQLPAVEIWSHKLDAFGSGSRQWSSDQPELDAIPLSSLLPLIAPVYVKNYGPGQLSSVSLRGAGAVHTAVIWNGFNLQNPMHGQIDFSTLPAALFSGVRVDLGANGALWGSGAVGGAVHLENDLPGWQSGLTAKAGLQFGQFGQQSQIAALEWGGNRLAARTGFFHTVQSNNFPFSGINGQPSRQTHAAFLNRGLTQDLRFRYQKHQFEAHFWTQESDRDIPPTLLQSSSLATQGDRALRLALHWQYVQNNWVFHLRSAFLQDKIDYRDPSSGISDKSLSRVYYAEAEAQWSPNRGHLLSLGLHQALLAGITDYYEAVPGQLRWALLGAYRLESPGRRWAGSASLRQEWTPGRAAPFVPTFNSNWKPLPWLEVNAQFSRHFRWPTLNDLYWTPGGNPDLQAEKGWGVESGLNLQGNTGQAAWKASLGGFSKRIQDWILWRPSSSIYWSPQNIALVWSRGLESSLLVSHPAGPLALEYEAAYTWVQSTSEKKLGPNDGSFRKQLVYTPEHTLSGHLRLRWNNASFSVRQQHTGRVYTASDHSAYLSGFWLSGLNLNWNFKWKGVNLLIYSNLHNIFNASYQVVQHRPMPGRWLEGGLVVKWNKRVEQD